MAGYTYTEEGINSTMLAHPNIVKCQSDVASDTIQYTFYIFNQTIYIHYYKFNKKVLQVTTKW